MKWTPGYAGWVLLFSLASSVGARDAAVYLNQTYEDQGIGAPPVDPTLRRVDQVSVRDGEGRVGEGKVAHYHDRSPDGGGALEYNLGTDGLSGLFITFDLLNNAPGDAAGSAPIIFAVGPWSPTSGLMLNANAKRAFGVEFDQTARTRTLALRVGTSAVQRGRYHLPRPQQVKVWVNDHDHNTLSYVRPDTGETVQLNPDSFVVWLNDELVGEEPAFGYAMQKAVTQGTGVLGRVGFSSTRAGRADFLIDNLYVEDPTGESIPVAPGQILPSVSGEVTPTRLAGTETMAYRTGENAMNLFVFRPAGWTASDRRPALVHFFGGGWSRGTPVKSAGRAAWAAGLGMVGIAPDYRTRGRFDTSPLAAVADGRAAVAWVMDHAGELGIDPARIAVGGSSAGGHVALWTALAGSPPGSNPAEAPARKPAAVILSSAVTDTSDATGYTPTRFGEHATALSPVHQLDPVMPPVLMFHAMDDKLVAYTTAVALRDRMTATGNVCELITVPEGGHGFSGNHPEWKIRMREEMMRFLEQEDLLPMEP